MDLRDDTCGKAEVLIENGQQASLQNEKYVVSGSVSESRSVLASSDSEMGLAVSVSLAVGPCRKLKVSLSPPGLANIPEVSILVSIPKA